MTDDDVLAGLDFDLQPKCDAVDHAKGTGGCDAGAPGTVIVAVVYCAGPGMHGIRWSRGVVCWGKASRLRALDTAGATERCRACGEEFGVDMLIRIVGPVEFNPENPVH